MGMTEVKVIGLSYASHVTEAYLVVLEEPESRRRLAIVIGQAEAQAIAITLEQVALPRPCTHDLFRPLMIGFDIRLERVDLRSDDHALYTATMHLSRAGETIAVDCRASDAIAIALRMHSPILVDETILEAASPRGDDEMAATPLENMPIEMLRERLERCVAVEAYEEAAHIQKIIASRTKTDENIDNSQ